MKKIKKNYLLILIKIKFTASEMKIPFELVGELKRAHDTSDLKKLLKDGNIRTIDLNYRPSSICALPNGNLLSCSNSDYLQLYDKDLRLIDTISNVAKYALCVATNNRDRIYIPNRGIDANQIVVTDLDLNKIKISNPGSVNNPHGLSFYNGYIYVCDYSNKRIQKLTEELAFVQFYQLDFNPTQIKVHNDLACVRPYNLNFICFYEIENFTLKQKYENHGGTISEINGIFYEYNHSNKKIYCYDRNGELKEEIETDGFNNCINSYWDGCLDILNNNIICSSAESKKLLELRKKLF